MTKRHYYPSEVQFLIENSFSVCSLFLIRHSELINTFQDHSRNKSVIMNTEIEKQKENHLFRFEAHWRESWGNVCCSFCTCLVKRICVSRTVCQLSQTNFAFKIWARYYRVSCTTYRKKASVPSASKDLAKSISHKLTTNSYLISYKIKKLRPW